MAKVSPGSFAERRLPELPHPATAAPVELVQNMSSLLQEFDTNWSRARGCERRSSERSDRCRVQAGEPGNAIAQYRLPLIRSFEGPLEGETCSSCPRPFASCVNLFVYRPQATADQGLRFQVPEDCAGLDMAELQQGPRGLCPHAGSCVAARPGLQHAKALATEPEPGESKPECT